MQHTRGNPRSEKYIWPTLIYYMCSSRGEYLARDVAFAVPAVPPIACKHLSSNSNLSISVCCREWVASVVATDPEYFERCKASQAPKYLWIGCSDSRVVAERALGLGVGELFVHRNVGNCLSQSDQNAMSALEYAVQVRYQALVYSRLPGTNPLACFRRHRQHSARNRVLFK
jgi:hypothetical protein